VLAHNVWAAGMPEFHRKIAAISSDMIVTAPIADRLAEIGWTGNEVISDSQMAIHYYQTTADRRIAFGKGGGAVAFGGRIGPDFDRSPKRAVEVRANFHRLYPDLRDVPIVADWCGAIDRSVTGIPMIGYTGPRRHIVHAVGWSANAVGPSRVGGQFVASLVLEADDAFSRSPLVDLPAQNFPPEPIRFLGSKLVRAAVMRKETAELEDRKPTRLDSILAAQVPSGMIPKD
jgi:glycine/D-amino acid oxidase-like deaminating enzyme